MSRAFLWEAQLVSPLGIRGFGRTKLEHEGG